MTSNANTPSTGRTLPTAVWSAALVLLTLLFFLPFFNRFAGLRSGVGEFTTGLWAVQGKLPYRDYFSATPPLNAFKSALLLKLFGQFLIVNRISGVVERVAIVLVLFAWFRRLFPVPFAFTGALVTIILSAGDIVDPIASYNHDAIFAAILSGFAASFVLDPTRAASSRPRLFLVSAAAGVFAGLSMITKQTIGVGALFVVPFVVVLLLLNTRRTQGALLWSLGFIAGAALPIAALALYLHRFHAWVNFLIMAFLKGPAAKGGHIGDFLHRDLLVAAGNAILVVLAFIAIACTLRAILRSAESPPAPSTSTGRPVPLILLFSASILFAEALALAGLGSLHNLSKAPVYFTLFLTAVLLLGYAVLSLRRPLTPRETQFALLSAVSFSGAFFFSLSWPAFEAMLLPGFGFLVAAALSGARPHNRRYIYGTLAVLIFMQVMEKFDMPFGFDGLNESSIRLATQPSVIPQLRGLRLPETTNHFLDGTLATIAAHSAPSDTIFTYPEMSLFYALSNRGYPTLAVSHNVDVVNDAFAAEEAARILSGRPAVVVYMRMTPDELTHEDRIWRSGHPSGQHVLVAAIEKLVSNYHLAGTYDAGQQPRKVFVYVRP